MGATVLAVSERMDVEVSTIQCFFLGPFLLHSTHTSLEDTPRSAFRSKEASRASPPDGGFHDVERDAPLVQP